MLMASSSWLWMVVARPCAMQMVNGSMLLPSRPASRMRGDMGLVPAGTKSLYAARSWALSNGRTVVGEISSGDISMGLSGTFEVDGIESLAGGTG